MPDAEQIVPRLAEVYLPGVLYVAFVGAIISAILSAVHSALHAPASQISHNIVVRIVPGLTDRGKLWSVRLTVMALSVVAYLLSVTSERIHDLVETASAFGSAGVFVTALFALFTRFGGPASAYASVAAGMLVWAGGKYAAGPDRALSARAGWRPLSPTSALRCCELSANEQSFRKQGRNSYSLRRACERCGHLSRSALITSNPLTNYATLFRRRTRARGLVRVLSSQPIDTG